MNQNSTKFLDFARSRGFRVAGSWFQCPQDHRWTWYSNAGGVAKGIEHVVVDGSMEDDPEVQGQLECSIPKY